MVGWLWTWKSVCEEEFSSICRPFFPQTFFWTFLKFLKEDHSFGTYLNFSGKLTFLTFSYPPVRHTYVRIPGVFWEHLAHVLNKWSQEAFHITSSQGYFFIACCPFLLIIASVSSCFLKSSGFTDINPIQDGGRRKVLPYHFYPVTSTNVRFSPENLLLTFSFNPFDTLE